MFAELFSAACECLTTTLAYWLIAAPAKAGRCWLSPDRPRVSALEATVARDRERE